MVKTTRLSMILATVALATSAAACGSDDDSDSSSETVASEPDTSSETVASEPDTSSETVASESAPASPGSGTQATNTAWEEVVTAAEEEGSVTLYSSMNIDNLTAFEEDFENEYDIDLSVVRGLASDFLPRIEAERATGRGEAGVLQIGDPQWFRNAHNEGYAIPLQGPNFGDSDYPSEQLAPEGTYFVVAALLLGFGWNTDLLPEGITNFDDLLDPALADRKIGIIESSGDPALVGFYKYVEEVAGEDHLENLAAQSPRVYPGNSAIQEALASGEIYAANYVSGSIEDRISQGAPVDWILPDGPQFAVMHQAAVLASAPNPNAAQVLANYMISAQGQETLARTYGSPLPDIPGSAGVITDSIISPEPDELTPEVVESFNERFRSLFQG